MSRPRPTIRDQLSTFSPSRASSSVALDRINTPIHTTIIDAPNTSYVHLGSVAQQSVDAYVEYRRIVGVDDNGVLFDDAQYEEYKQQARIRRANRLYASWCRIVESRLDCRQIGPQSKCFCGHRFYQHTTDMDSDGTKPSRVKCKESNCKCLHFMYIHVKGSQDIKCHCKHSYETHSARAPYRCTKPNCNCNSFSSSLTCACGSQFDQHRTIFETREERLAAGLPVDNLGNHADIYAGMGGVTNFSSLLDGVDLALIKETEAGTNSRITTTVDSNSRYPQEILSLEEQKLQLEHSKGKWREEDEMALYEQKYKKQPLARRRAPVEPSKVSKPIGGERRNMSQVGARVLNESQTTDMTIQVSDNNSALSMNNRDSMDPVASSSTGIRSKLKLLRK